MSEVFGENLFSTGAPASRIRGLRLLPGFITEEEERRLLAAIDDQAWSTQLKRRVQHYGYRYDYKARAVFEDSYLGALPDWMGFLLDRLNEIDAFTDPPDQAIINEYQPGQGIAPHIDCVPCFTDTIASLSLGSCCQMTFSNIASGEKVGTTLSPRSMLILQGEARYQWRHAIPPRKSDVIGGLRTPRRRRVSVTFRKVISAATA